jgi:hypothetical protein
MRWLQAVGDATDELFAERYLMFVERRLNQATGAVELWWCEWEMHPGEPTKKVALSKISDEPELLRDETQTEVQPAICWSYGRTLGNIAVFSDTLKGCFPDVEGTDAQLPCDFVKAGKFRNGPPRWWCRTHQTYWGTKSDIQSYETSGEMTCSEHGQKMSYVVSPLTLNLSDYDEVGVWCSMPAAISTEAIDARPPRIHVHVRPEAAGRKSVDGDFQAISILYSDEMALFGTQDITRVNITPPSAFEFVCALEAGREMSCVNCTRCGYPHLDLGEFARVPHIKHYCGNCGCDSTRSNGKIISTPLKPLHDQFAKTLAYEVPARTLNLDDLGHCRFTVWASTPAVVWTASRPQELGIHVHVHDGTRRTIDDTFGSVTYQGKELDRGELVKMMIDRSIS